MYFKDRNHAENYLTLQAKAQALRDREFQSSLYVLAAIGKDLQRYVEPGTIRFTALKKDAMPWSSSEKALVKLAATLFNAGAWPVPVGEVFYSLDQTNTQVALEAIRLRYGPYQCTRL